VAPPATTAQNPNGGPPPGGTKVDPGKKTKPPIEPPDVKPPVEPPDAKPPAEPADKKF